MLRPTSPSLPETPSDPADLAGALADVERIERQLGESRGWLEAHVAELQDRLELVSAERLKELDEKERLAKRLGNLLDSLPGGVVVIDGHGEVQDANPSARELLGEPLLGAVWRDVIQRAFSPRHDDGHEISLRDGRRVSISIRSLEGEPGQLILLTDLTETRRLQAKLARHERLSALGRMTASLAHQVRTPLSAALIYASHLTEEALPTEHRTRFASRLKERLHQLERQVRDMLLFARGDLPRTDRITPADLMRALRSAAEPHLQDVAIRWQCDAHAGELTCNLDTLVGALQNLIDNGVQAAGSTDARLKVHLYRRDDSLHLCVSDNGPGIAPQVVARLEEPFFTTKATGTGLGLAVARAVVHAHEGQLRLMSRPGRGTCVHISIPLRVSGASEE